jgi:hypothetical protein
MSDLLAAALNEERTLLQRLEAVQTVIKAYGGTPVTEKKIASPAPAAGEQQQPETDGGHRTAHRRPNERTTQIRNIARDYIASQNGSPVPTRELLPVIERHGIDVGGKDKNSTLSALLSYSDEFESNGRAGWTLAPEGAVAQSDPTHELAKHSPAPENAQAPSEAPNRPAPSPGSSLADKLKSSAAVSTFPAPPADVPAPPADVPANQSLRGAPRGTTVSRGIDPSIFYRKGFAK